MSTHSTGKSPRIESNLLKILTKEKWSQRRFALAMEVTSEAVNNWALGKRLPQRLEDVLKMEVILKRPISSIFVMKGFRPTDRIGA